MTSVTEIQDALKEPSPEELAAFREWFAEFDAALWDNQFERDVAAGRLDQLADEALEDMLTMHSSPANSRLTFRLDRSAGSELV